MDFTFILAKQLSKQHLYKRKKSDELIITDRKTVLQSKEKDICEKEVRKIAKEISNYKHAIEELEKSEANLTAIIENNDAHVYSIDRNFKYIKFNTRLKNTMKQAYGMDIKQGDDTFRFLENIDPAEAKWWKDIYMKAFSGQSIYFIKDYSTTTTPLFMSFSICPIFEKENIIGLSCFSRDITKEKFLEEEQIKSKKQSRDFATHLNNELEDERARIAREIHDEFGQQFAGIKMGLSSFKKISTSDKTFENKVNSMSKDVDNIIQSLKKIATGLRPGILDTLGLVPSIEWLAKEFEAKRNIKCKLELNVKKQKFEEKVSICFFRICQEALTNISKHANASEVTISVKQNKNELILKIADNGEGFSIDNPEKPFSMGLIGMRERAQIIGADLQIVSKKKLGTTIQLKTNLN